MTATATHSKNAETRVNTPVYLDYQATTPLDSRVLDAMMPYLTTRFGNPHSESHRFGWEAHAGVDVAREQVAALIGATPEEIIFTSGATESNNTAIKGVARALRSKRRHLVTVVTEHKCVLESFRAMEREGAEVTYLPVGADGLVDLERLAAAVRDDTALVSVMLVNNEIGVIQPVAKIAAIAHAKGAKVHTDAAQAVGKIPVDVGALDVDLMSLSGHKIYGPKGVGALYVRRRPRVPLVPLMDGGGQERGLRSGTLAPALCAGMGKACAVAGAVLAEERSRIEGLSRAFLTTLRRNLNGVILNGSDEARYWGNLNLSFEGVDGDRLIASLRALAVSSGAACASGSGEPSYVLRAIGVDDRLAKASIRIGFGRTTTAEEAEFAANAITDAVRALL
ncbi:MAG: aminotransferase class V-fold PLP-dependent enzyme [Alphaproteobacteria bacterium]|nr:MAG: aminotransferase class V-fold PLP-dependent enzyme [Alphaproteobacteria bacterium]